MNKRDIKKESYLGSNARTVAIKSAAQNRMSINACSATKFGGSFTFQLGPTIKLYINANMKYATKLIVRLRKKGIV